MQTAIIVADLIEFKNLGSPNWFFRISSTLLDILIFFNEF